MEMRCTAVYKTITQRWSDKNTIKMIEKHESEWGGRFNRRRSDDLHAFVGKEPTTTECSIHFVSFGFVHFVCLDTTSLAPPWCLWDEPN